MRYYHEPKRKTNRYAKTFICGHPVFDKCTLFMINDKGLCVIQQRYDPYTKHTWWGEIDDNLCDELYLNINFKKYFDKRADVCKDGIYPVVTIRQMMWGLKMKPLKKERWETVFDRQLV